MLLPIGAVNFKLTLKAIYYFGILVLPLYLSYNYGYGATEIDEGYEDGILMTMSYRVLPYICASFFVFLDKSYNLIYSRVGAAFHSLPQSGGGKDARSLFPLTENTFFSLFCSLHFDITERMT